MLGAEYWGDWFGPRSQRGLVDGGIFYKAEGDNLMNFNYCLYSLDSEVLMRPCLAISSILMSTM
jgi:hypothetical protein